MGFEGKNLCYYCVCLFLPHCFLFLNYSVSNMQVDFMHSEIVNKDKQFFLQH